MGPIYIIQAEHRPDLMQKQLNDEPEPCFIHLAALWAAMTLKQILGGFQRNCKTK